MLNQPKTEALSAVERTVLGTAAEHEDACGEEVSWNTSRAPIGYGVFTQARFPPPHLVALVALAFIMISLASTREPPVTLSSDLRTTAQPQRLDITTPRATARTGEQ